MYTRVLRITFRNPSRWQHIKKKREQENYKYRVPIDIYILLIEEEI